MGCEGGGPGGGGGVCPAVERRRDAKLDEIATGEVEDPLSAAVLQSLPLCTTDTGRLSYSSSMTVVQGCVASTCTAVASHLSSEQAERHRPKQGELLGEGNNSPDTVRSRSAAIVRVQEGQAVRRGWTPASSRAQ